MEPEVWISSELSNHVFSVSNTGKIKNNKRGKEIAGSKQSTGYMSATFDVDGKMCCEYIHRMILFAFRGPPPDSRMTSDHINTIRDDNRLENLRWFLPEDQARNTNISENRQNSIQAKQVVQCDTNGTPVRIWPSRKSVAEHYSLDARRISEACSNNNLYHEFYWKNRDNIVIEGEEWRPVVDSNFVGFEVSNHGRVRTNFGHISWGAESNGYKMTKVRINGKATTRKVHCLSAEAFIGPKPGPKYIVNHKDGIKHNNYLYNLEWITSSGNALHAHVTGLHGGKHRPVVQFTLKGNPIAIYKGSKIVETTKGMEISSALSGVCKTCGGYKWMSLDEIHPRKSEEYKFLKELLKVNDVIFADT
jgi:hypothetical protein